MSAALHGHIQSFLWMKHVQLWVIFLSETSGLGILQIMNFSTPFSNRYLHVANGACTM